MSKRKVPSNLRRSVEKRARGICEYCLALSKYSLGPFNIEHIIPEAKGGKTLLDNLAWACHGCNSYKAIKTEAKDPVSLVVVPLFHPRKQKWDEHFAWENDYKTIVGLTPIGRATVEALRLNRAELINLRSVLLLFGEHPPRL
jgi:hypothetical protein